MPSPNLRIAFQEQRQALIAQRSDLDRERASINSAELDSKLASVDAKLASMNRDEVQFNTLTHDASVAEDEYALFSHRLGEASAYEDLERQRVGSVRVIQPPSVPSEPRSLQILILGAGFVLALLSALMTAIIMDMLSADFMTPEQLERLTGLPALAVVSLRAPGDLDISDDIKPLVHKLTGLFIAGKPPILTFIAARAGEGASTVARAFALSLHKEAGKRVLLITNEAQAATGLVETLASGQDMSSALSQIGEGAYSCSWAATPAGRSQIGALLQNREFWQSLQNGFDVIVIDAPSLQTAPEGIACARFSDATIVVVEAEKTRKQVVENLRDTLTSAGVKLAGTVLNKRKFHIPGKIYKHL